MQEIATDVSVLTITASNTRDGKVGEGFRIDTIYADVSLNPKYALENLLHIKTTSKQGIALFYRIFNAHYEVLIHNLG